MKRYRFKAKVVIEVGTTVEAESLDKAYALAYERVEEGVHLDTTECLFAWSPSGGLLSPLQDVHLMNAISIEGKKT